MKVSVIIPCYNHYHYLNDAIESVLLQRYDDLEIIVVDDCSSIIPKEEPTLARAVWGTLQRTDRSSIDEVKYIKHERNRGLAATRNTGMRAATGELLLPLDADDKIHPDCITKMVQHYKRYERDIISSHLITFGQYERISKPNPPTPTWNDLRMTNRINCCSLFSKSMWEELNGYDELMRDGYEDWEFWLRAAKAGYKIYSIPEILFYYRKHPIGESMLDKAKMKRQETILYMRRKGSI